jgi:AraC-like DNA-binding protein
VTFDVLTEVLEMLRIRTTLYAVARLNGQWGVRFPQSGGAYFHFLDGHQGWLSVDGEQDAHGLGIGDVVLLAHGSAHRVTRSAGGPIRVAFDADTWLPNRLGVAAPEPRDDGPAATLVCGKVEVHDLAGNPLLAALPTVVRLPASGEGRGDLSATLALIDRDRAWEGPGSEVLLARLGDVLLIQIIRAWLAQQEPGHSGWLSALRDPQIAAALAAIHAAPQRPWTVAGLAHEAALSRSRFAQRFTALVGEPPLAYVSRWRMARAATLIRTTDRTVGDIATAVGYRSEPAFTRAFTRHYGTSPRRYSNAPKSSIVSASDAALSGR